MRILMITHHLPYPPFSGTPLRNYSLLKRIARNHEVWLATLMGRSEEHDSKMRLLEICQGVETTVIRPTSALSQPAEAFRYLAAGKPPELRLYQSADFTRKIRCLLLKVEFDVVDIVDSYMGLYLEALPDELHARTLLTFIDVVFNKYDRISRLEPKLTRKLRTRLFSCMMHRWEPFYAERFGRCVAVSESDRQLLLKANPRLRIDVIPNGVDTNQNQLLPYNNPSPALIFVGNMGYRPNIDAMSYFCQMIFPRLRDEIHNLEMWIIGIGPTPVVQRLDGNGVHVTGKVDDLAPYYSQSQVCVVPLRAGGGTRLKILEAMAYGRPVVSTSIGCEGLDVVDGEHLLIANNPDRFVERTLSLLMDEGLRRHITTQARSLVEKLYDWDVISSRLLQVYTTLANEHSPALEP
jgi:sugar transferase (PEP-CTERM/EpsH1 system associated)